MTLTLPTLTGQWQSVAGAWLAEVTATLAVAWFGAKTALRVRTTSPAATRRWLYYWNSI